MTFKYLLKTSTLEALVVNSECASDYDLTMTWFAGFGLKKFLLIIQMPPKNVAVLRSFKTSYSHNLVLSSVKIFGRHARAKF